MHSLYIRYSSLFFLYNIILFLQAVYGGLLKDMNNEITITLHTCCISKYRFSTCSLLLISGRLLRIIKHKNTTLDLL